ncbi:uncharacterized protein LOC112541845 [Python bivittatus]|uniref:Monocyte differentiation antigen CD14 n=1 Tax=Python bivittatus TaxID=176946 RepID=A0A9F5MY45_PYTBI|nr:uncharacterized protein LOC112541845 [Python bivittatus]
MGRFQAFMFFLLLGLKLSKAEGNCIFVEVQQRCTCSLLNQTELKNVAVCLLAAEYELKGGNLEQFVDFSEIKPDSNIVGILRAVQVKKLIFTDLFVPEVLLPGALEFISYTPLVSELEFVNCTFLRLERWQYTGPLDLKVTSLYFHKVIAAPLDERFDISSLNRWLETLKNLTLTESQVTSIPCKVMATTEGIMADGKDPYLGVLNGRPLHVDLRAHQTARQGITCVKIFTVHTSIRLSAFTSPILYATVSPSETCTHLVILHSWRGIYNGNGKLICLL